MNICEHLTTTARLLPQQEAIVFEGKVISYSDLDFRSRQAAAWLIQQGIKPGDRVALLLPNVPAFAVWYYATLRMGAIAVSVSTRLSTSEVDYITNDCNAAILVVAEALAASFSETPSPNGQAIDKRKLGIVDDWALQINQEPIQQRESTDISDYNAEPNEPAVILYTSGTTGFAKGAVLSHRNVGSNTEAFHHLCGVQQQDRLYCGVPLFHCFGQNALMNTTFFAGATLVLQRRFDLPESEQLFEKHRVTQVYGVPMMFQLWLEHGSTAAFETVEYCFSAAANLPIQVSERWQATFEMPIYEGYGLTETSPFASYNHRLRYQIGSIGSPIDSVEMKIIDTETKQEVPVGEPGEIAIRGPNVMLGYWKRDQETAAAIQDGWFHTGDIGRKDADGLFYLLDRVKDMIAVGGLKVYPAEVERVFLDHPAVSEIALIGVPDKTLGERVEAFVVPLDPSQAEWDSLANELKQFAAQKVADYKTPRRFHFTSELPRNPSGKVLKRELRELANSQLDTNSKPIEQAKVAAISSPDAQNENGIVAQESIISPRLPSANAPSSSELHHRLAATHANQRMSVTEAFLCQKVVEIRGEGSPVAGDTKLLEAGLDSLMMVELAAVIQQQLGLEEELPSTLVFEYPTISALASFSLESWLDQQKPKPNSMTPPRGTEVRSTEAALATELPPDIAAMSDDEALQELLDELEN